MAPLTSIWEGIRSILGMPTKPTLNIRFSNAILKELDDLVESGAYTSSADIVNRAVVEFLAREGMRPMIREEIRKMMEKEKG
jgi:Arc/MetJ-type ribon-helix-helix transcriptional regulator